jgi:prepilin-type N-terminal cleavage/methylation domain-containing protein
MRTRANGLHRLHGLHGTWRSLGRRRGFSLLEVLIALVILIIGSLGAVTGMLASARALRAAQDRLHGQVLVDASLQRARLHSKQKLYEEAVARDEAASAPSDLGLGQAPWALDLSPTSAAPGDLGSGGLFLLASDGTFARCDASSTPACPAGITSCLDEAIPLHAFCREVADTRTGAKSITGAYAVTRWVRVVQRKEKGLQKETELRNSILGREVFVR